MSQQYLNEIDDKFKIKISGGDGGTVYCPLPDEFGFTVSSTYSELFDLSSLNGALSIGFAAAGLSQKFGVAMKKMFTNPEPTEISFDAEFAAYYNARGEVLNPVKKLLQSAAPSHLTSEEVEQAANENGEAIGETLENMTGNDFGAADRVRQFGEQEALQDSSNREQANKAMAMIGLIKGPSTVNVQFGNVFTLKNVFISGVSVSFSNVLDPSGIPMKATCGITLVLQNPPVKSNINGWFSS